MTDEFPRVRLQLVRYLHEQMGFDVLALEGSAVDSWVAQDFVYHSNESAGPKAKRAQELAWFGLWQTDAMRELMKYAIGTQTTSRPLYLASFDVQPGNSRAFQGSGAKALDSFFQTVQSYAPSASPERFAKWKEALSPFFGCYPVGTRRSDATREEAEMAMREVQEWVDSAIPRIKPAIHGRALLRVVESLRTSIELCTITPTAAFGPYTYLRTRDRLNAGHALALHDLVSESHRIILWAHHSHVNNSYSAPDVPSMGKNLLSAAGGSLYTIGLFAGEGEAIAVDDQAKPPIAVKAIRPAKEYAVEQSLSRIVDYDFLVDLSPAQDSPPEWREVNSARAEVGGKMSIVLARDFHAAIFIHKVHPPEPMARMARSLSGQ
jgi:erythromycin esterase